MEKITSPKITPFLWFDNNAEEAAKYYTSVFKNSKITFVSHYGEGMPLPKGTAMTVAFELDGSKFTALNGGRTYKFSHAVSFVVNCENQEEIDYFWDKLSEGGKPEACGWLLDKYGLSWQIVPSDMGRFLGSNDPAKSARVMQALMKMTKLIIADLENA
ncbi:MAG: VOC family protein [Bacteroidia bacterium]